MQLLLQNGAQTEGGDIWENRSPLYIATVQGHVSIINMLIDRGASYNTTNKEGTTALAAACHLGNVQAAEALMQRGANPNQQDKLGNSAADIARKYGYKSLVESIEDWNQRNLRAHTSVASRSSGYAATSRAPKRGSGISARPGSKGSPNASTDDLLPEEPPPAPAPVPMMRSPVKSSSFRGKVEHQ